jgi:ABC-type multidrug transport system ATPase subunit
MTTNLVIETHELRKRFGDRSAVAGVDLNVPEACAFGFLGPNCAGKTTLIRMLLGLTQATSGEMRLLGLPVPEQRTTALARVGAIVEEPRFHAHLTGRENLRTNAAARGQVRSAASPELSSGWDSPSARMSASRRMLPECSPSSSFATASRPSCSPTRPGSSGPARES